MKPGAIAKEILKVTTELLKENETFLEDGDDVVVDFEEPNFEIGDIDEGEDDDIFKFDDVDLNAIDPDYDEIEVNF